MGAQDAQRGRVLAATVAETAPDAMFVVDGSGVITYANHACVEIVGWPIDRLVGRSVLDFAHPDDAGLVLSSIATMPDTGGLGTPVEIRTRTMDGEWRWLEIIGRDRFDDPRVAGIVCAARDLTRRRMWEVAKGDDGRMHQVLQHAPAIVMLLDRGGFVTGTNAAFTRLLGHDPSRVVGRPLAAFVHDGGDVDRLRDVIEAAAAGGSASVEVAMATTSGGTVPIRFELVNLLDDPVVAGLAVTGHDVTDLHEARRLLEHVATHDALTGLPNRSLLARRLGQLLADQRPLALLYVDLDHFKPVNDRYGHAAGDELLRQVGRRLLAEVSSADVVARIGGDEFVVLAIDVTTAEAAVELGRRVEAAMHAPFELPAATVCVGASVGVALAGSGSSVESLLYEADGAMYEAKRA
jgi:diguanylate cyclase (GGDEF)-like protein/PAS domain S-box-containing protein